MYLLIEKGLRWGISYITKRYREVSNKYMKNYDPTKPSKYIAYLDESNVYDWGMSDYLPYDRSKWLTQEKINNCNLNSIIERSWTWRSWWIT